MSNQMNSWLADIYGTNGAEDIEKTAQMHLLNKLAEDQNVDLSQFSPEELQELAQQLLAEGQSGQPQSLSQNGQGYDMNQQQPQGFPSPGQNGMGPAGQGQRQQPGGFAPAAPQGQVGQQPQPPQMGYQMAPQGAADAATLQKEAQAKFEEADLLGRVMAHSYTNELEKIAGAKADAAKHAIHGAAGKAKNFAGKAAAHVKGHKGAYGAAAGAAGAGFAAGRMSKKASAFEKLAEMHAADILSSTGFDPSTGQDMAQQPDAQQPPAGPQQMQQGQPQQPQMGQQPQGQPGMQQHGQPGAEQPQQGQEFGEALDNRALEMLSEAGYDVNEILARLQLSQGQQGQA